MGVVTTTPLCWLVTQDWYMCWDEKIVIDKTHPAQSLLFSIASQGSECVLIYDETELLRWIIKGNPHK